MAETLQQLLDRQQQLDHGAAISALSAAAQGPLPAPALGVNLAEALLQRDLLPLAQTLMTRLLDQHPHFAPAWARRSELYLQLGQIDEALESARRAVALAPDSSFCRLCLGIALKAAGLVSAATMQLGACLQSNPRHPAALSHYGLALSQQGRHAMALDALAQARDLDPEQPLHHSNWLMTQQYLPRASSEELRRAAQAFGKAWTPATKNLPRRRKPAGPPVVGVISSDLYHHPVGIFLLPVLEAMGKQAQRWRLYHDGSQTDAITRRLEQAAGSYLNSARLDRPQLAQQLQADGVNVLLELGGHSANNRLHHLAQRLAPVQLSWLGYAASSGLSTVDGVLMGDAHMNEASSAYFTEDLKPLPGCHLLYAAGNVGQPPGPRTPGPLRLGCFNNSAKINEMVLDTWAQVLTALPSATLLLKWRSYQDPEFRRHLRAQLSARGVTPERLLFEGHTEHSALLASHGQVDIALDTFPFNGGLTSCEALSMGTPVVTMAWQRPVGRQGAALLAELGYGQWIASNSRQYVAAVQALAADPDGLQQLRQRLPQALKDYQQRQAPVLARAINRVIEGYFESTIS